MDGNKDDALRCLKIGKDALGLGDRARALKFISKAQRLDPSLPVDNLISKLESDPTATESPSASSKPPEIFSGDTSGVRHRVTAAGSSLNPEAYTEEQVTIVREIKRKNDYYEILGLEKRCTIEDIRKSYRKLSLKVHPDKNKAPGSEEAFKKVSKAFKCLSVDENRILYDHFGSDEVAVHERPSPVARHRHHHHHHGFHYDGDVDADEIFRTFFFGGMNHGAATTQFTGFRFGPGMGAPVGGHGSGGLRTLIQLLPVVLILLLQLLPSNEPIYSLSRSYGYEHRLSTKNGVNFFVKSADFGREYPLNSPERSQLEEKIEYEYISILSHECRLEIQRVQWGYQQETPNCDMLKRFEALTT